MGMPRIASGLGLHQPGPQSGCWKRPYYAAHNTAIPPSKDDVTSGRIAAIGCGAKRARSAVDSSGGGRERDAAGLHEGQDMGLDLPYGVVAPLDRSQVLEEIGQTA